MKKLIVLMLAIALVLAISSTALAVDIPAGKITLAVQPVDYVSALAGIAQPTTKTYVANERYALLISITIPSYMDTSGLALEVSPKNCTVDNLDVLTLADGNYIITGTALASTASVKVTIKDTAINTASTANELWAALYGDRTVSATATLGVAAATTATDTIPTIPKTGDPDSVTGAALCLLLAAALMWRRRHA